MNAEGRTTSRSAQLSAAVPYIQKAGDKTNKKGDTKTEIDQPFEYYVVHLIFVSTCPMILFCTARYKNDF